MDIWKQRWDERYSDEAYAYGEEPNVFLAPQLQKLRPGKVLFAAEGEGRNAVFAAQLGWDVAAFDISEEGRKKATMLAAQKEVTIDYRVGALEELDFEPGSFDAVVLIYAHIPQPTRSKYQQLMASYLRQGGHIIVEGFSKEHLRYVLANEKVGGPKEEALLLSETELAADFAPCDILLSETREIELQEGTYHNGIGSVVRFVAVKR
jgi:2-polyprenyl-3-methyl-5-hydroxy-6-metoxy-1,4-benzoquinol methylase